MGPGVTSVNPAVLVSSAVSPDFWRNFSVFGTFEVHFRGAFFKKDLTNRSRMDIINNNIIKMINAAMGSNSAFALRTESRRVVRGGGGRA